MINKMIILFLLNIMCWALPKENIENSINKAPDDAKNTINRVLNTNGDKKNIIIKIPLIYISDFNGRFINVNGKIKENETYYHLLEKIKYYQTVLPILNKWERAITLNNGSTFWPSISIKYLLKQKRGIDLIYSLLKENNFDVINIGKKDFYTPYGIMDKLSKNKKILKLPFMASNVNCKNSKDLPLCRLTKDRRYKILNINNIKIGIISVVSSSVLNKTFYKSIKNMKIGSEVEKINKLTNYLKNIKKVNIIILLAQIENKETSPRKTIDLSKNIKNVDLIISNIENTKLIRKYDNRIYIVGANPNRYIPNLLLLNIDKKNDKYKIFSIDDLNNKYPYKAKVSSSFKNILKNYRDIYFKKYDIAINKMKINNLSFNEFYTFILKLMVSKTDSEIGLINSGNFNKSLFPINKLTYDIIEKTIRYNNRMTTFYMIGKLLKKFLKKNKGKLLFTNIKFGKMIKINGRNIIDKKEYKIVTTEFIANGGDNFFKDEFFIEKKKKYSKIKDLFKKYLRKKKFMNENSIFSSKSEFEDLSKRFLWEFYSNLGIYYIKNDSSNSSNYDKSKLNLTPTELLKLDSVLNLTGSSKNHIIKNVFELHYYQSNENNTSFQESDDSILYSFNYKNSYFKANNLDNIFIPLPFFETRINSELTKPKLEKKHYFELFLSAGISFLALDNKFEFKLGLQSSKDFRYSNNLESGILIGYQLNNYQFKNLDIPLKITSKANYFLSFDKTNTIDFLLTINIPILGFFHFSSKLDSYIYKEINSKWSYSYNLFFGVNMIYDTWY